MKIAVAGTGYVGLSLAVLLAQRNEVVAIKKDVTVLHPHLIQQKIRSLQAKDGGKTWIVWDN